MLEAVADKLHDFNLFQLFFSQSGYRDFSVINRFDINKLPARPRPLRQVYDWGNLNGGTWQGYPWIRDANLSRSTQVHPPSVFFLQSQRTSHLKFNCVEVEIRNRSMSSFLSPSHFSRKLTAYCPGTLYKTQWLQLMFKSTATGLFCTLESKRFKGPSAEKC